MTGFYIVLRSDDVPGRSYYVLHSRPGFEPFDTIQDGISSAVASSPPLTIPVGTLTVEQFVEWEGRISQQQALEMMTPYKGV